MIRSVHDLKKFDLVATDGRIGSVEDFYFDDHRWAIRYMVVDTGGWLPGRRVLVSPVSVVRADWSAQRFVLSVSRQQVRDGPDIDTHARAGGAGVDHGNFLAGSIRVRESQPPIVEEGAAL